LDRNGWTIPGALARVLSDVAAERIAQDARWGVQDLPDGTGASGLAAADEAKRACREAAGDGTLTWRHILSEEFLEALAESEPGPLRTELVQTAAVAVKWIQTLDRRHGHVRHRPSPGPQGDPPALLRHAVRALLLDGDDLILIRRTKPGRPLYWTTPGGGVEPGDESPEAALRRELDEELGATADGFLPVFTVAEQTPVGDYWHSFFLCRLVSMDLSRRHGPEFSDPARGAYDVERVPCTPEALAVLNLNPALLVPYLQDHAADLPGLLPAGGHRSAGEAGGQGSASEAAGQGSAGQGSAGEAAGQGSAGEAKRR
jgi:8-oxo-dGTP pyrophosphatase MutT (NUDIX family)